MGNAVVGVHRLVGCLADDDEREAVGVLMLGMSLSMGSRKERDDGMLASGEERDNGEKQRNREIEKEIKRE